MNTQNKLLVICGTTATGKTDLGIYLAKKYNGEIISADSRQVYKNMTIGTGKQYSKEVIIWGYDLVEPTDDFSVAHFQKFARQKISDIQSRNKLPILVGGTGLYIKSVIENIDTTTVPPNSVLRETYKDASAESLFQELLQLNPDKAHALNDSDKKNPRRLIRALEISLTKPEKQSAFPHYDTFIIGLTSDISELEKRLKLSINRRMHEGMISEVQSLLTQVPSLEGKAFSATGYKEIAALLSKEITEEEALHRWYLAERQYVKRQLTWFRKLTNVHWFNIFDEKFKDEVEESVKKWHNMLWHEK